MPNELSSIEGLADKHLRVLARHYVTDLRGLFQADRRVIYRATANLRPRPTDRRVIIGPPVAPEPLARGRAIGRIPLQEPRVVDVAARPAIGASRHQPSLLVRTR